MCKKYVNAVSTCYESVLISDKGIPLISRSPFDIIRAVKDDNEKYQINSFDVMTDINILGTATEEHRAESVLYDEDGRLSFILRLTKCDRDREKRIYYDLDRFEIKTADLRNKDMVDIACFEFANYTRITNVHEFAVNETGLYVLKLLIKDRKDTDYTVQFIRKIKIVEKTCN